MTARRTAKRSTHPYLDVAEPDELDPASRVAHAIVTARRDLLPSVDRIMTAELDDDARVRAITMFRDSLERPGDPHRDPRVSIADAR